jgi:hypothetical protein
MMMMMMIIIIIIITITIIIIIIIIIIIVIIMYSVGSLMTPIVLVTLVYFRLDESSLQSF